jgi:hypothetical protein
MAQFRVEFVKDQRGKFSAELYYPPESDAPTVRTRSIYRNEADALLGVVNLFKDAIAGGRGTSAAAPGLSLKTPNRNRKPSAVRPAKPLPAGRNAAKKSPRRR